MRWQMPPAYPYRMAFSLPYYHQKLLVYVLNGVHNHYILCEEEFSGQTLDALYYFLQEQAQIDALIQEGLVSILKDHHDWIRCSKAPDYIPIIHSVNRLY